MTSSKAKCCACGCGRECKRTYVVGHNPRRRGDKTIPLSRLEATSSCLLETATHSDKQRQARYRCVQRIQRHIAGRYTTVLDPMAGVGDDALLFSPDARVNDIDPTCVAILQSKFKNVTQYDIGKEPEKIFAEPADLVYLDYNPYTLGKFDSNERVFDSLGYRDITDWAFKTANKFVIINDCSIHGLNFFSWSARPCYERILGVSCPDQNSFLEALPNYYRTIYPEWELTTVSPYVLGHGATTYLLFERIANIS